MIPALNPPEAFLTTTFDAVFADVASTAKVLAVPPLYVSPVIKLPGVKFSKLCIYGFDGNYERNTRYCGVC